MLNSTGRRGQQRGHDLEDAVVLGACHEEGHEHPQAVKLGGDRRAGGSAMMASISLRSTAFFAKVRNSTAGPVPTMPGITSRALAGLPNFATTSLTISQLLGVAKPARPRTQPAAAAGGT